MKSNSRAYNRDVSKRKALRKRRITQEVYWGGKDHPYYDNLHQFSKNKIHCSCPMCSTKSKNRGRRRKKAWYSPTYNWKITDLRKFNKMDMSCEDAGV